jgi:hypothetical protein
MAETWTNLAVQNGLLGVAMLAVAYAIRSVWLRLWPHIDNFLRAWLNRYETTTNLLEKMQSTLAALTVHQAEIVGLIRTISGDERRERKAMQRLATLFESRRCLFGIDLKKEIFGDSDEDIEPPQTTQQKPDDDDSSTG